MIKFSPSTAHLISWIPPHSSEVLYLSPTTLFPPEKSIRGGVPICWPAFAAAEGLPFHGFARDNEWDLINHSEKDGQENYEFHLSPKIIQDLWGKKMNLHFKVTADESLTMELISTNLEHLPVTLTLALHTYFRVGDIHKVEIAGHNDIKYYDKVADQNKIQSGKISFIGETDRIYHTAEPSTLIDHQLQRKLLISKSGSDDTVIWNPWSENAKAMKDIPDLDYLQFCCVEAANTHLHPITLLPGASHTLMQKIEVLNF